MSLDPSQVEDIAHLARLGIDRQDIPGYARDLSAILEFEAKMAEVDTTAIEPLAHPLDMVQRLRPDTVTEPDRREEFQALAPASEAGLYLVPRVIE